MAEARAEQWHEVLAKTEWVAIVTQSERGPHVVATWGAYIRDLSDGDSDTLVVPAGRYHQTEKNLQRDRHIQVMLASRQVAGSHGPGQGYLLEGEGEIQTTGAWAQRAKAQYPWARGALVIRVQAAQVQL